MVSWRGLMFPELKEFEEQERERVLGKLGRTSSIRSNGSASWLQ